MYEEDQCLPPSYLHSQHLPDCRIQHFSNLNFIGVCFAHMCASVCGCGSQRWASVPSSEVVHFLYLGKHDLSPFLDWVEWPVSSRGPFVSVSPVLGWQLFHHSEIFMWFLAMSLHVLPIDTCPFVSVAPWFMAWIKDLGESCLMQGTFLLWNWSWYTRVKDIPDPTRFALVLNYQ